MASNVEQYAREIHDNLKYWATWLPGTLVRLGDCGTVDRFVFNRRSSLRSYGIGFESEERGPGGDLAHQSARGVEITFKAAGESVQIPGLAQAEAGAGIEFTRDDAVVFAARDCVQTEIAEPDRLAADLRPSHDAGGFPGHYVVVTSVVNASSATVLVSRSRGASATIRAQAGLALGDLADLASASAGVSMVRSKHLSTGFVAEAGLTPLFKVMGFKTHWYNGMPTGDLQSLGAGDERLAVPELKLAEADFDDYAEYAAGFEE